MILIIVDFQQKLNYKLYLRIIIRLFSVMVNRFYTIILLLNNELVCSSFVHMRSFKVNN